jgi:hypothetical protein
MIYSVYNTTTRLFDYYQTNELAPTHAGAPAKSILASSLGASPEQAAWTVPVGAKKTGSGVEPRGRIATKGSLVPFAGLDELEPTTIAAIGIGAYFIWKHWRK